jgi:hypothetical protein
MVHLFLLLCLCFAVVSPSAAEDIPLMTCDSLPVVQVGVANMKFLFLLDTAATSMLNLKSFAFGEAQNISVISWSGMHETKGQKVTISDLLIGEHHLRNLTLSAVDLSAIGRACGSQIDGIMGIDVLRRLGAVVDLKSHVAQLPTDSDTAPSRVSELDARLAVCAQAFNRADEKVVYDCLDPAVVVFTEIGDFYGREAAMKYYRQRRQDQHSRDKLVITPRAHHLLGEAIWVEYELRGIVGQHTVVSRGTALCRKTGGNWRILHLNSSPPPCDAMPPASP